MIRRGLILLKLNKIDKIYVLKKKQERKLERVMRPTRWIVFYGAMAIK